MKRFLLLLLVFIFFPCFKVFAQAPMLVFDSAVATIMELSHGEQLVKYGQMIYNQVTQLYALEQQVEHAYRQTQMAVQNLKGLQDIHSWDDFMDWYNRQLYYERYATESIKGMNVSIGKKNYSLYDLDKIAEGLNETYVQYWNNEFTEEQRREMWLELGLSPSNYAYVQPYREKAREIAREHLAMSTIQQNKNMERSMEDKEDRDALKRDTMLPADQQMGDKELQQRQLAALNRISETMIDISAKQDKQMEAYGVEEALKRTPVSPPPFSTWNVNGFSPVGGK